MNHRVPDFQDMEEDYSVSNLSDFSRDKRPATDEEDIMEMLWQNGQLVLQSQKQRPAKRTAGGSEVVNPAEREIRSNSEEMHLFMQEDEMASWLQYPLDDSALDRELYADLLYSAAPPATPVSVTPPLAVAEIRRLPSPAVAKPENLPRFQNFVHFSRIPSRPRAEPVPQSLVKTAIESTVVESCGTSVLRPKIGVNSQATADSRAPVNVESYTDLTARTSAIAGDMVASTCELTATSSPDGSGASFIASVDARPPRRRSPLVTEDRKRKGRKPDDAECQSEDAGFEGAEGKKQCRGSSSSTKRSRAADVHNLSERRRRDRINEKMRALQELIPRCNKSDKASMLDEAIEYLKSLQLQVQMMSMGYGMFPMMYPGMQQYMPHMGMRMGMGMGMGMDMGMDMGMNHPLVPYPPMVPGSSMPSAAEAVHMSPRFPMPPPFLMPRVPLPDTSRIQAPNHNDPGQNPVVSNTPTQPRMPNFADPYQQYVGIHQPQLTVPKNQEMNPPWCEQAVKQQRNRKP